MVPMMSETIDLKVKSRKNFLLLLFIVVLAGVQVSCLVLCIRGLSLLRGHDALPLPQGVKLWIALSVAMVAVLSVSLFMVMIIVQARVRRASRNETYKSQLERYQNLSFLVFTTLAKPGDFTELLKKLTDEIRRETGLTSVGLRLRFGNDYPYVATSGFEGAAAAENPSLLESIVDKPHNPTGDGPQLRCLCGEVLKRSDHLQWPTTPYGSIWTNDFEGDLLKFSQEKHDVPCMKCNFRSVAIVPIRISGTTMGLLKFNSTTSDEFSQETVECLESLAIHVGEFLQSRAIHEDYSGLVNEMSEAVIVMEQVYNTTGAFYDLKILSANPAFKKLFGLSTTEVVGTLLTAVSPSIATCVFNAVLQALETGREVQQSLLDDVLKRAFDFTVFSLDFARFVIVLSDVTERRQAERALIESRRQYASLIANMPGIVFRSKLNDLWEMEFISNASVQMLGYSPDDFYSGRIAFSQLIDQDFKGAVLSAGEAALAEHRVFKMEYPITAKNGEKKWIMVRGTGVYDSYGKAVAFEGLIIDISERRKVEADRERFATAIEQSRDAIVITNENGVILYANSAIKGLSGYDKDEVIGTIMPTFESPPIDSDLYHSMWKTLYKGKTWESHFPGRHKDGTPYTENVVLTPVMNAVGKVDNFVSIRHDVTQELRDSAERDDLREQLNQTNKMESIGRLAGGIAHDFNNMLQAILGYSEMAIAQTPPEGQLHADLLSIQRAARKAADLTRQLLIFARRSKSEPKIIGVARALENLSSLLTRVIGSEFAFTLNLPEGEFTIRVDPTLFDQVIANLCINARDAVAKNVEGRIVLSAQPRRLDFMRKTILGELPPGDYVELSVVDNGCGIPDENMTRLFEPFFTTKGKGKGVGLGLSTAYGVMKSCNGGIIVKSKVNVGTSFVLLFPQASGSAAESNGSVSAVVNAMPKAKSNEEIILLVDDEETILYTTRRMLESLGYQVLSTLSALEGVEIAKQYGDKLSLLLSDVIMPELNGPEMVRKILADLPNLPYLYMSGYTANLLAEHGVSKQAVDMIHKPFTRTDLAKKVRECLDKFLNQAVEKKIN